MTLALNIAATCIIAWFTGIGALTLAANTGGTTASIVFAALMCIVAIAVWL